MFDDTRLLGVDLQAVFVEGALELVQGGLEVQWVCLSAAHFRAEKRTGESGEPPTATDTSLA